MPKYRKARIRNKIENIYGGQGADKCQGCGRHHGFERKLDSARRRRTVSLTKRIHRRDYRMARKMYKKYGSPIELDGRVLVWNKFANKYLDIRPFVDSTDMFSESIKDMNDTTKALYKQDGA